jgi:AcrR family transcriptional regulator
MKYTKPKQERSRRTEQKSLEAFTTLILKNGFARTTLDDIAISSWQTLAAFIKRFGSKEQALLLLYSRYCDEVLQTLERFLASLDQAANIEDILRRMSQQFEVLLTNHFAANHTKHDFFR